MAKDFPQFQASRPVRAGKILDISRDSSIPLGGLNAWRIAFVDPQLPIAEVSGAWIAENQPHNGGYIVLVDGELSFASSKHFEATFAPVAPAAGQARKMSR